MGSPNDEPDVQTGNGIQIFPREPDEGVPRIPGGGVTWQNFLKALPPSLFCQAQANQRKSTYSAIHFGAIINLMDFT
jgi:hypothetical protein